MQTYFNNTDMNNTMNNLIERAEKNLQLAKDQLSLSEGILTSHNRVVVWPDTGLTVSRSEDGDFFISPKTIASQWTTVDADAICKNITNGSGEHPIAVSVCEYYRSEIGRLKEIIEDLKSLDS